CASIAPGCRRTARCADVAGATTPRRRADTGPRRPPTTRRSAAAGAEPRSLLPRETLEQRPRRDLVAARRQVVVDEPVERARSGAQRGSQVEGFDAAALERGEEAVGEPLGRGDVVG